MAQRRLIRLAAITVLVTCAGDVGSIRGVRMTLEEMKEAVKALYEAYQKMKGAK